MTKDQALEELAYIMKYQGSVKIRKLNKIFQALGIPYTTESFEKHEAPYKNIKK